MTKYFKHDYNNQQLTELTEEQLNEIQHAFDREIIHFEPTIMRSYHEINNDLVMLALMSSSVVSKVIHFDSEFDVYVTN